MVVNEDLILEIVRPGTGDPVPEAKSAKSSSPRSIRTIPLIRFALGDLSAIMPGASPCGRTNTRIRGWMGRADQTAKVKGMFVRPEQIAEVARRHPELGRLRLVVTRENEQDVMTLQAESTAVQRRLRGGAGRDAAGRHEAQGPDRLVAPGSLPNDGKVIADERPVG